jgi:sugar-specific transcriptional regulator TrmB
MSIEEFEPIDIEDFVHQRTKDIQSLLEAIAKKYTELEDKYETNNAKWEDVAGKYKKDRDNLKKKYDFICEEFHEMKLMFNRELNFYKNKKMY